MIGAATMDAVQEPPSVIGLLLDVEQPAAHELRAVLVVVVDVKHVAEVVEDHVAIRIAKPVGEQAEPRAVGPHLPDTAIAEEVDPRAIRPLGVAVLVAAGHVDPVVERAGQSRRLVLVPCGQALHEPLLHVEGPLGHAPLATDDAAAGGEVEPLVHAEQRGRHEEVVHQRFRSVPPAIAVRVTQD